VKIYNVSKMYTKTEETAAGNQAMDSESREFQDRIAGAKNRLKELSASRELNEEEKQKKQQELRRQIAELNQQLKQRQMEVKRQEQEQKKNASEELRKEQSTDPKEEELFPEGLTQTGMKAIVTADASLNHATAHGNMAQAMEGRVRVLQGEIKQDEMLGRDTEYKKQELEKLQKKASRLQGAKMGFLSDASLEMKQAAEQERASNQKTGQEKKNGTVRKLSAPFQRPSNHKTDIYKKGTLFSNVEFHF